MRKDTRSWAAILRGRTLFSCGTTSSETIFRLRTRRNTTTGSNGLTPWRPDTAGRRARPVREYGTRSLNRFQSRIEGIIEVDSPVATIVPHLCEWFPRRFPGAHARLQLII